MRVLKEMFDELRLEKHHDNTIMGRAANWLDLLGFQFSPTGFSVGEKTVEKFLGRTA